jgi:membrane protease YdiL (CAAX protease family)
MERGEAPIDPRDAAPQRTSRGRIVAAVILCFVAAAGLGLNYVGTQLGLNPLASEARPQMDLFQGRVVLRLAYFLEGLRREGAAPGFAGEFAGTSVTTGFKSAAGYFDKAARGFESIGGAPTELSARARLPHVQLPRRQMIAIMDAQTASAASAAAVYSRLGDDWRSVVALQRAMDGGRQDVLFLLVRLYANERPKPEWLDTPEFEWIARNVPAHLLIESEINRRLGRTERVAALESRMYAAGSATAVRVEVYLFLALGLIVLGLFVLGWGVFRKDGFGPYLGLPSRPWGPWEGFELVGAWIVLSLVIGQFAAVGSGRGAAGLVAGITGSYVLASVIALAWFAWAVAPRGTGLRTAGWRPAPLGRSVATAVGAYAAAVPVLVVANLFANRYLPDAPVEPLVAIMIQAKGWGLRALLLLLACVIAPVVEETVFRGGLYGGLRNRWSLPWAAVVSSAAFAAVHLNLAGLVPVMALGVALCIVYERTGSVVPAMICHGVFNLATVGAIFVFA